MIASNLLVNGAARFLQQAYFTDISVSGTASLASLSATGDITAGGNLYSTTGNLYFKNLLAINGQSDNWLRINANNAFAGGTYFGSSIVRTDGTLQVGSSGAYLKSNSTNTTIANLVAPIATITTGAITTLTASDVNANNVSVANNLHATHFDLQTVAQLGGSFYVSPTVKFPNSGTTLGVTKSGTTLTLTITDSSITSTTMAGIVWSANSRVKVSGTINGVVTGTMDGTVSSINTSSHVLTLSVSGENSGSVAAGTYSASQFSDLSVMVYQRRVVDGSTNNDYRVGIWMNCYDLTNSSATIRIYGGTKSTPNVMLGNLYGMTFNGKTIGTQIGTQDTWGILTSMGYFEGAILSTEGQIGGWTIGDTKLYNNTDSMTSTSAGIYLGTNGIRNYKDANTFVNITGGVITAKAVDLTGKITATSGSIAGWRIEPTYLASGTATAPTANTLLLCPAGTVSSYTVAGTASTGWMITAGTTFGVTKSGGVYATSGKIAGWSIDTNSLQTGTYGTENGVILCTGTSSAKSIGGSASISGWTITSGAKFGVTKAGVVYGSDVHLTGEITATSGTIGGASITDGVLQIANANITSLDASKINSGSIAAARIASGTITADKLAANTLHIGGHNLLKSSYLQKTNSTDYNIANVYLVARDKPVAGETVTIQIKGTLAATKTSWGIYNSGGSIQMTTLNSSNYDSATGIYTKTFEWKVTIGSTTAANTHISIYTLNNNQSGASSIEWIMLERGNQPSGWGLSADELGGFNITNNSINSGTYGSDNSVYISTANMAAKSIGGSASTVNTWRFTIGSKFGVTSDGSVYASALTMGISSGYHALVSSNGLDIYNNTTLLSSFGTTTQIGASNANNFKITATGIQLNALVSGNTPTEAFYVGVDSRTANAGTESNPDATETTTQPYYILGKSNYNSTISPGSYSVAEGYLTVASGAYSHAEGYLTTASKTGSHAEGRETTSSGLYSHTEGYHSTASGTYSHAEGSNTTSSSLYSHAEGDVTTASNWGAHAEGSATIASGAYSHAEGDRTTASAYASHAEGYLTTSSAQASHTEGQETTADETASHAEGYHSTASGTASHAEGRYSVASGAYSHAEGYLTTASGDSSHAGGLKTIATGSWQTAIGKYNAVTTTTSGDETIYNSGNYAFIVGNGASDSSRSNALTVDWSGNLVTSGSISANGRILLHSALTSNGTTATTTSGCTYGVAGVTSGNRIYSKWYAYLDTGVTSLSDGMTIQIKIPVAGSASGCGITIDGGTSFHPVVYATSSVVTTHYGNGNILTLVYDSSGTGSVFGTVAGATATAAANITGVWRVLNMYDSNSDSHLRVWSSATNLNVPLIGSSSANSTTATWSTYTGTYRDWYGAIPNDDSLRPKMNLSTGVLTVPGGIVGNVTGNVTGNATTATTATTASNLSGFKNTTTSATAVDSATTNGIYYVNGTPDVYNQSDGAAFVQAYSASWVAQIYQDYRTGQIALRGKNNGTWQSWRKVLDSSNYTDYTVTKTGTGASGSWGISITGSSASCTGNAATATTAGNVTGTVAVGNGGTGATSFTANSVIMSGSSTTAALTTRSVTNNTSASAITASTNIITANTLAYWNGAYSGTTSRLAYCNQGAFGTMATKSAADYATLSGATFTGGISGTTGTFSDVVTAANIGNIQSASKSVAITSSNTIGATPAIGAQLTLTPGTYLLWGRFVFSTSGSGTTRNNRIAFYTGASPTDSTMLTESQVCVFTAGRNWGALTTTYIVSPTANTTYTVGGTSSLPGPDGGMSVIKAIRLL